MSGANTNKSKDLRISDHESGVVKLDVGGTIFRTSVRTLTGGDNMLSAMLLGRTPIIKTKDGSVFIDRSAKHFGTILTFLRDKTVALPESKRELTELKTEAEYYCMADLAEMCKDSGIVTLDVGGVSFKTSVETLTKGYCHMLAAMFSGRLPVVEEKDGSVFIDRDAKHFGTILNFLRDGIVALPETKRELAELKTEAEYYGIMDLVKMCGDNLYYERYTKI